MTADNAARGEELGGHPALFRFVACGRSCLLGLEYDVFSGARWDVGSTITEGAVMISAKPKGRCGLGV